MISNAYEKVPVLATFGDEAECSLTTFNVMLAFVSGNQENIGKQSSYTDSLTKIIRVLTDSSQPESIRGSIQGFQGS